MLREKIAALYKKYFRYRYLRTMIDTAKKAGFKDVNDYIDSCADGMAQRAVKMLFQEHGIKLDCGTILEVGSEVGRFTREIQKYVSPNTQILCLENHGYAVALFKQYIKKNAWTNVNVIEADYFNHNFKNMTFDMVMIPWFIQLTLYQWGKVLEIGSRITKPGGYFIFDFIDSRDSLIDAISNTYNAHHYLINGSDVEKIANHYGFKKKFEFNLKFNVQTTKYFVYQRL